MGLSQGTRWKLLAIGASALLSACAQLGQGPDFSVAPAQASDPSRPPGALVFAPRDPFTGRESLLTQQLSNVGLSSLPFERQEQLSAHRGVVALGSFASESPHYAELVRGDAMRRFVARGNVVVQFTQADQTEAVPPFLPSSCYVRRSDRDSGHISRHGAESWTLDVDASEARLGWELFDRFDGVAVHALGDARGRYAAIAECAHGHGRFVMVALASDRPSSPEEAQIGERILRRVVERQRQAENVELRPLEIAPSPNHFPIGMRSETLAVLPDTQIYSRDHPHLFVAQTRWLAARKRALGLRYVLHVGDIVHNNHPAEWAAAWDALSELQGQVPYALALGNHDFGPEGSARTRQSQAFSMVQRQALTQQSGFAGAFPEGTVDNSYHLLSLAGRDFIVIVLEWAPRSETLDWANAVMRRYPNRLGILLTHAYLNHNDRRYDIHDHDHPQDHNPHHYATPGRIHDGEEIFQRLVRHHAFVMTFSGHVLGDGVGYLVSRTDRGTQCHQMLANFQTWSDGGAGYLRLIELRPGSNAVTIYTFSPAEDRFLLGRDHFFSFQLDETPSSESY